ncbi:MAG: hypothetical protein KIS96_01195 [Bauldia sp.]|nr:hypothetical protein [Bauldia sp.]
MSVIANCLARLVRLGRIDRATADAAQAIHDGLAGRLAAEMPSVHAEAYAALNTAKLMVARAAERKLSVARQAIRAGEAATRVTTHGHSSAAGLMAEMTTDIRGMARGGNVESLSEVLTAEMMQKFKAGAERMGSRFAGLVQDRAFAERFIDEVFEVDSGDDAIRAAARGFKDANEWGVARAKAGGKVFTALDDWRLPQPWSAGQMRSRGADRWVSDAMRQLDTGGIAAILDRNGVPLTRADAPARLREMHEHVTLRRGGAAGAFSPEMRAIRFAPGKAGAAAWRELQGRYGAGRDIYGIVTGHIAAMAREIAFIDQWGPDYNATFRTLVDTVRRDEVAGKARRSAARVFGFESAAAAERTFKVLTGEANVVQSEAWAGILGGIRAAQAAADLGGAVWPSVFGDSVTAKLAANWNGVAGARVIARAVAIMIKDNPTMRADAARLGLTAYAVTDALAGSARYLDDTFGPALSAALRGESGVGLARRFNEVAAGAAQFVIRVQGLQAWTEAMKRAFSMEMLALVAKQRGRAMSRVDVEFRRFLESHGFTAAEWDALRATPALDIDGAQFFDIEGVADRRLGERLLGAIVDERRYAILEPSARVRQWTTQALPRGSLMREVLSSVLAYKSFPISMMLMHGSRLFTQEGVVNRLTYLAKLAALGTLAGAAVVQARSIFQLRDPRPMNNAEFWGAALIQGGGLGIFGDLLYEGYTRGGGGLVATLAGPIGSRIEQVGQVVFPTLRSAFEGEEVSPGAALYRLFKSNTPGSNLWFVRGIIDRYVFDQVQRLVDGDYEASRRRLVQRMQREYGNGFFWAPGTLAPQRAPDFGNALR